MGIRLPAGRAARLLLVLLFAARSEAAEPGYTVTITGSGSKAVTETVAQVSELMKRAADETPPPAILRQRAEQDRERIDDALRALGYYDGKVAVDKTRTNLVESGLFSSVRIDYPAEPAVADAVPIAITLVERPHHSVAAGVSYSTNFGPGITGSWEDRNLFHDGQKLSAVASY